MQSVDWCWDNAKCWWNCPKVMVLSDVFYLNFLMYCRFWVQIGRTWFDLWSFFSFIPFLFIAPLPAFFFPQFLDSLCHSIELKESFKISDLHRHCFYSVAVSVEWKRNHGKETELCFLLGFFFLLQQSTLWNSAIFVFTIILFAAEIATEALLRRTTERLVRV